MSRTPPDTFVNYSDRPLKTSTTLKDQGTGAKFTTGYVKTVHGTVGFYMQHPHKDKWFEDKGWLVMEITKGNEFFNRQWNDRAFTDSGIIRLANRFMDDVRFGTVDEAVRETKARYSRKKGRK